MVSFSMRYLGRSSRPGMRPSKKSSFRRGRSARIFPSGASARTLTVSGEKTRITQPSEVRWGPRIAKGSSQRADCKAATSASCALQPSTAPSSRAYTVGRSIYRRNRDVPNLPRVFGDRAVGGEPPDVGGIENAGAQPALAIAPRLVDLHLSGPVRVKIGAHHEIVVVAERIDEPTETLGLVVGEDARADLSERLAQLRRGCDALRLVDTLRPLRLDFRGGETEDENVVLAVEISSERAAAGMIVSARETL